MILVAEVAMDDNALGIIFLVGWSILVSILWMLNSVLWLSMFGMCALKRKCLIIVSGSNPLGLKPSGFHSESSYTLFQHLQFTSLLHHHITRENKKMWLVTKTDQQESRSCIWWGNILGSTSSINPRLYLSEPSRSLSKWKLLSPKSGSRPI